jgi:hypothetical protein
MRLSLSYKKESGLKGFRPKGDLFIPPHSGISDALITPIVSDEEYGTQEEANEVAWQLALALRNRDYPGAELVDQNGRLDPPVSNL